MTRDELLQAIVSARTFAQSYLAGGDGYLLVRTPKVVAMLDIMEARVRASPQMPEPDAFDDVPLGLYAVRELEELDGARLTKVLCRLNLALKPADH